MLGGRTSFTSTTIDPIPRQPLSFTVTEYVPEAAIVASGMLGLLEADENPFGPAQLYDCPFPPAFKTIVPPGQTGLLLVGLMAALLTVTEILLVPLQFWLSVTVTV